MPKSKNAPASDVKKAAVKKKKFHPAQLTKEEQEQVLEYYLGVHPRYLLIQNDEIRIDMWNISHHQKHFMGFFSNQRKLGKSEEDINKQRKKLGY